ncbi:MAG: hypothetical protein J7L90_04105 [Dehalococcoidia bacterium]|nr:hypothetical protein [Dehalococcoidia bacterium]
MDEQLIKRVISSIKCSTCGHNYQSDNVSIMGHQNDLWILEVYCPTCATKGLVAALINHDKLSPNRTDLTRAEQAQFNQIKPVGIDDVLDMHNLLDSSDGDILSLLSQ